MDTLDKELHQALGGVPKQIFSKMLHEKLQSARVKLSRSQRKHLENRILEDELVTLNFRHWRWWRQEKVVLDFTEEDIEKIGRDVDQFIENDLDDLINSISTDLSLVMLAELRKSWPQASKSQSRDFKSFRKQIETHWGSAIALLKMLLKISNEFGEAIGQEFEDQDEEFDPYLRDVLTRLHARGCQVTEEIICLLEAGLADGAMARWRTLHEIAVVSLLIEAHGDELAERYIMHDAVESKKAARQHQLHHERLGLEPLEDSEIRSIDRKYTEAIEKYGKSFKSPYGWSAYHLGKSNPNFADIEAAAEIDHWRPFYKLASQNVHASSRGTFLRMGLFYDPDFILAGPSSAGLADPGHNTAISLMLISNTLAMQNLSLDKLVMMKTTTTLADEIGQVFWETEDQSALEEE